MVSKYEKLAKRELEVDGWLVDWKIRATRPVRGYSVDYWGLFDILAYKYGEGIRMISVKGRSGVPLAHRRAIEAFNPKGLVQKEIWSYESGTKVKKEII